MIALLSYDTDNGYPVMTDEARQNLLEGYKDIKKETRPHVKESNTEFIRRIKAALYRDEYYEVLAEFKKIEDEVGFCIKIENY